MLLEDNLLKKELAHLKKQIEIILAFYHDEENLKESNAADYRQYHLLKIREAELNTRRRFLLQLQEDNL